MLGFPPHTTHKLQPLDVAIFGALKTYYSQVCDAWMVNNPGKVIRDADIGRLFGEAYNKAATVGNAVNGFKACDIEPYNPNIFSDDDFASAVVTERPIERSQNPVPSPLHSTQMISYNNIINTETNSTNENSSATKLPSLPAAQRPISTRRPRAKFPSLEITSSPVKSMLESKIQEKVLKEQNKKVRIERKKAIKEAKEKKYSKEEII